MTFAPEIHLKMAAGINIKNRESQKPSLQILKTHGQQLSGTMLARVQVIYWCNHNRLLREVAILFI
jgi:hypothetical protein